MNTAYFIASKISGWNKNRGFAGPIVWLASATVALSLAVMIVSVSIVTGFQGEITEKVTGLQAHIQVTGFSSGNSFEVEPVPFDPSLPLALQTIEGVAYVQAFASKPAIIKTGSEIQGVLYKGLPASYNPTFFERYLKEGTAPVYRGDSLQSSSDIVVSTELCKKLFLKLNDTITAYFINRPGEKVPEIESPQRAPRRFRIAGIYETGLAELDEKIVWCDMRQVQDLNNWYYSSVAGYEVMLNDVDQLDALTEEVRLQTPFDLNVRNVKEIEPEIFLWLEYQNINVFIIITLMILIGMVSMTSALLILILEKTQMIGILRALGATHRLLVRIFLYRSAWITGTGMLAGNAVALLVIFLQNTYRIIKLDKATYYVEVVPMHFSWQWLLIINAGTFAVCLLAMLLPVQAVKRVKPIRAIRFD
ncbi:MAG: ABC transporter permease [Flavobacteriales bacterium]